MKILFTFGGIPHYLDALLNKLSSKSLDITVVTPQSGTATIGQGVKLVEATGYKNISILEKKMFYGKSGFPDLDNVVIKEQPDILVLGWPYFLQVFFQPSLRKAIRKCHTKFVIREIPFQTPPYNQIISYFKKNPMYDENMRLMSKGAGFYLKQWIVSKIRKYCYSQVAGTINYSTNAYNIIPFYGVNKDSIYVTYNSTDTDALLHEKEEVCSSQTILPINNQRILHIGRLVKWKRVDLLVDSFKDVLLSHPKAELVIIGKGPELENLQKQTEQLGINKSVRFIGAVYDSKKLGAYMNESTIYVLAGMGGLSINDAMTYGLPIICSVCDSTEKDLVTDGINGLFFEEGNALDLSKKIDYLLSNSDICKQMGKESEKIISEKININTVAESYYQAFLQIRKEG